MPKKPRLVTKMNQHTWKTEHIITTPKVHFPADQWHRINVQAKHFHCVKLKKEHKRSDTPAGWHFKYKTEAENFLHYLEQQV